VRLVEVLVTVVLGGYYEWRVVVLKGFFFFVALDVYFC
jgi:hypothetical protein